MTEKTKAKRTVIIITVVAVLIGGACLVLANYDRLFEKARVPAESKIYLDRFFYEPDYSKSLREMEGYGDYLELDRLFRYKKGNVSLGLTKEDVANYSPDVRFFYNLIEVVRDGDTDSYNSMFTKKYLDTNGEKEDFTPQMIYDVVLEYQSTSSKKGITTYGYDLSYRIYRNDGTFRNDIYSDETNTQYIEIDDSEGEFKISSVSYYIPE